jgi:MFS family permease
MAVADSLSGAIPESAHRTQLRRAIIASTIGTTIEWYDFLLYSVVTGLVFAKLFFPKSDPLVGVLEAFAIYFVGFIARPIGAAIFGHYGDRIGRKGALIATLLLTGLATFAVGFVPTYDSIGVWGAVILTVIRFIQGIGVGGEWGGSVLLSMEWARTNKHRCFICSWPQLGGPGGLLLANLAVLFFSRLSGDQFRLGLEDTVPAEHRDGGRGALHPAGHPGNAGVPATSGGESDRAGAGLGGDQAAAQGDHPIGPGAHG